MRRILSLVVLAVAVPSITAQQKSPEPVRICVATLMNSSRHIVSPVWERKQLVRALEQTNKSKDVKKGKAPRVEVVELESSGEPDSTVRDKDCRFVLYTDLTEVLQANRPGVSIPPPGAVDVGTTMGDPRAYPPEYHTATVNYRLMRAGDLKPWSRGVVHAEDQLPEETLVTQLMNQIAERVVKEIRKPHAAMPE